LSISKDQQRGEIKPQYTHDLMRQELFAQFHNFSAEAEEQIELATYDWEPLIAMEVALNAIIRTIPTRFIVDEHGKPLIKPVEKIIEEMYDKEKIEDQRTIASVKNPLDQGAAKTVLGYVRRYRANIQRFEKVKSIMEQNGMWFGLLPSVMKFDLVDGFICEACGVSFKTLQELYRLHLPLCEKNKERKALNLGELIL
jgi:hypothetical protein